MWPICDSQIVFLLLSLKIRKEIEREKRIEIENWEGLNKRKQQKRNKFTVFNSNTITKYDVCDYYM